MEEIKQLFIDQSLYTLAMTHSSYANQFRLESNEKLEFLGDKVINLVIAELLWESHPQSDEGELSVLQASLSSTASFCRFARLLELDKQLMVDPGEQKRGCSDRTLEDAFEALIGALYLDQGYAKVREFVTEHFGAIIRHHHQPKKDVKSTLQELAQKRGLAIPQYEIVAQGGSAHEPHFEIEVSVQGLGSARGVGSNKKVAQMQAATKLLEKLGEL